jgi:hypothetical protein
MMTTEPVEALRDPSLDRGAHVRPRHGTPTHARTQRSTSTGARTRSGVTPVRLRLMAIGLAVLALVVGLVTALTANDRDSATSAASQTAEPLVVEAQAIDTYLSDADTTAAGWFVEGRLQPAALRVRYTTDLTRASASLALAAQAAGGDPAVASAIRSVAVDLPIYSGLVQTATFNERQAYYYYPLATAYIGEANNLMRHNILPAATRLYTVENQRLTSDQDNAMSAPLLVTAALFILVLLVLLIVVQVWMSRHFRRTFNVFLAVSTAIVLVLGIWFAVAVVAQSSSVDTATGDGSGPVVVFTQARIGALQMTADDELTLLTRDSVPTYQQDYTATIARLHHLMSSAGNDAGSVEEGQIHRAEAALTAYAHVHQQIRHFDKSGDVDQQVRAVALASGEGPNRLPAVSSNLDGVLGGAILNSQQTFDQAMSGASGDIAGLIWASAVLSVVVAAFILLGFRPRIAEYR